ncbi:MAG: radical SAM protein [Candidatus Diapherotrites archaeon]
MEWPLTFQCNNDCISCISDTRQAKNRRDSFLKQVKDAIDNVPEKDIISFTGGEPTLRKEFFEILEYARKKHPEKFIFIVTNGRRFSEKDFFEKLLSLEIEPLRFGIPLYSHREEVHDRITRAKGSWSETIQGIKNLLGKGFKVELRILVEKANYRELKETAKFAAEAFPGLERVVFINLKYTGNAFLNREQVFLRIAKSNPFVLEAADLLLEKGIETKLFHFPLCTIPEKYRPLAEGITKQESELTLLGKCNSCRAKASCPQIWKTYLPLAGEEEFGPCPA